MKPRNRSSIDGFVPRRQLQSSAAPVVHNGLKRSPIDSQLTPSSRQRQFKGSALEPSKRSGLSRSEIDESLASIDDSEQTPHRAQPHGRKKLIKRLIMVLLAIFIIGGLYIGIKALIASGSIFKGNLLGVVQSQPLKQDENGRSNIVIFGTSEDDEGGNHPGAYLTDSIMVLSVDQNKKNAFMFSIPRDLWVKYGTACNSGYEGKINEVFNCYSEGGKDEAAGSNALRERLKEVTGVDVQYYAHVNYSVVREAVDAVGGVEVTIDSQDPRGILDRNFDWKCQYRCYFVKYPNGSTGSMDGEHALALARARGSSPPTYGLERGNFDRERHQQKILKALQQKALSAGTITNLGKVTALMDALGNNLRTNFETSEIRTLMNLGGEVQSDNIKPVTFDSSNDTVLTTGNVGGQSIVRPVSGLYDYSKIKSYLKRQLTSDEAAKEAAKIGVYNGSEKSGLGQAVADKLTEKGFNVVDVGNAPDGKYPRYKLYVLNDSKLATKSKLEKMYGVSAEKSKPPFDASGLDVVVIIGRDSNS